MAHIHSIEDKNSELVDIVYFCSDACHREWCEAEGVLYEGWNGCHEFERTEYCLWCGVVLPGLLLSEDGKIRPCECQLNNVVVNRFSSEKGEKCEHGNWIQLPRIDTAQIGRKPA